MHWFGEGPLTEDAQRASDARERGYKGWLDRHGHAVMSRTSPEDGQALGFETRGHSGRGTADETRARGLGKRR